MSNISSVKKIIEIQSSAAIEELIYGLYHITVEISPTCRQVATLFLSGFFVVGVLLIIPALMQTAAAYVWAAQIRRESIPPLQLTTITEQNSAKCANISHNKSQLLTTTDNNNNTSSSKNLKKIHRLSKQDRTLFLYRLLACGASLLVLIFSTLPQLVIVVAKPQLPDSIDKRWGWCHAFVYADHVTRCFASYLIVIPFGLLFWNFLFSEIKPRHNLLMHNVFGVILKSSIMIAIFSLTIPIPIVIKQFEKKCSTNLCKCGPTFNGLAIFIYYDFVITRILPAICVIFISIGFLLWLPRSDYGVFYEPTIFLAFMIPHILCEIIIHIFHRVHIINKLINTHFGNFMLLSYAIYHMSFSCTFVLATLRSILSEIREERRKRSVFLFDDNNDNNNNSNKNVNQKHGTKRRTHLIEGLQKQFSVAYRWKPDFTDEETGVIAGNVDVEQNLNCVSTKVLNENVDNTYAIINNSCDYHNSNSDLPTDDVMLHYAILQRSASLKRQEQENRERLLTPQMNRSIRPIRYSTKFRQ